MQASGVSRGGTIIGNAIVLLSMSALMTGMTVMAAACADGMGEKQPGQPCTRTEQCASPLICSGGTCGRGDHRHPSDKDAQTDEEDAGPHALRK
jgi:hypothetical protein